MQERWFCKYMRKFEGVKEQCRDLNITAILHNSARAAHDLGLISEHERDIAIDDLYPKTRLRKIPFISR